MSLADELYRETILDHYHNPRNRGQIDHPSARVEGINPLCGDELVLYLDVKDGKISDVKIEAKGCSINMASGSMMTEAVLGQSVEKATEIINKFKRMMTAKNETVELSEELEDLEALEGVRKYPVRIKCALLPWNTLLQGIVEAQATPESGAATSAEATTDSKSMPQSNAAAHSKSTSPSTSTS